MALNIINKIRKTEEEASDLRSKAHIQAKGIVAKAERCGEELKLKAEKDAHAKAESIINSAKEEVEALRKKENEIQSELSGNILKDAEKLMQSAVSIITEEIYKL